MGTGAQRTRTFRPVAVHGDVYKLPVARARIRITDAEPLGNANAIVVDQYVRARDQLPRHTLAVFRLQIEADALLAAVDARRTDAAAHRSERIALWGFDFDDASTEIRKHRCAERRSDDRCELDDRHPF